MRFIKKHRPPAIWNMAFWGVVWTGMYIIWAARP